MILLFVSGRVQISTCISNGLRMDMTQKFCHLMSLKLLQNAMSELPICNKLKGHNLMLTPISKTVHAKLLHGMRWETSQLISKQRHLCEWHLHDQTLSMCRNAMHLPCSHGPPQTLVNNCRKSKCQTTGLRENVLSVVTQDT